MTQLSFISVIYRIELKQHKKKNKPSQIRIICSIFTTKTVTIVEKNIRKRHRCCTEIQFF